MGSTVFGGIGSLLAQQNVYGTSQWSKAQQNSIANSQANLAQAQAQINALYNKIQQQQMAMAPKIFVDPWKNCKYSKEECIMAIGQKCNSNTHSGIIIKDITDHYINDFISPANISEIPFIDKMRKNNPLFKLVCPAK